MKEYSKFELDNISILSVKHTGTNFLHQIIREGIGDVRTAHYSSSNPDKLPKIVLSPIRHPYDCFVTWYSRGRFGPDFFTEWKLLNECYLQSIPMIVPVDTDQGPMYLQKMANKLDCILETNWEPVESQTRYTPPNIDLSEVYELEVVQKFYEV